MQSVNHTTVVCISPPSRSGSLDPAAVTVLVAELDREPLLVPNDGTDSVPRDLKPYHIGANLACSHEPRTFVEQLTSHDECFTLCASNVEAGCKYYTVGRGFNKGKCELLKECIAMHGDTAIPDAWELLDHWDTYEVVDAKSSGVFMTNFSGNCSDGMPRVACLTYTAAPIVTDLSPSEASQGAEDKTSRELKEARGTGGEMG